MECIPYLRVAPVSCKRMLGRLLGIVVNVTRVHWEDRRPGAGRSR